MKLHFCTWKCIVKYHVYNKMYARTRIVTENEYENLYIQPLFKSPEIYYS